MSELLPFLLEKLAGAKRLAVLGVGSTLRGDDAAGMLIIERLLEAFPPREYPDLLICGGGTAPENFSGNVRLFAPDHLLIIDAADAGCAPGSIVDIPYREIGGPSFSAHMLPLKIMADYLVNETGTDVTMLGLQYKDIEFGADLSPEMRETVEELTEALLAAIPMAVKRA
ncbi:MAG TPA: hydrogenase 3 maturation endopeptidase HyCI [Feifaniaceae bacterium]|nr:hydrogenase 3 maturation endopeptidase HyCI [Feifaniaceae bacterium]